MFSGGYSSVASIAAGLTCLGLLVGFGVSHSPRCHHSIAADPDIAHTKDDEHAAEAKMADKARDQEMSGHADDDDDGEALDDMTSTTL